MRPPKKFYNQGSATGMDPDKRYADKLVSECLKDPERAATAILPLCNRVCNNGLADMNSVLSKLNEMGDGEEIAKISGANIGICGDYAKLMRDAMVVSLIVSTLSKHGLILALPKPKQLALPTPEPVPAAVAPGMNMMQAREVLWSQIAALESQIEGFIAFQSTTDLVSPYGQLIFKLATVVLAEIKIRKVTQ